MKRFFYWLVKIWSDLSIILIISDDDNFGTFDMIKRKTESSPSKPRYSMMMISLGPERHYFLTYKDAKLSFHFALGLESLYDPGNVDVKTERYNLNHLTSLDINSKELEKEMLCYKIAQHEARIDSAQSKINLYSTVFIAAIPLAIVLLRLKVPLELPTDILSWLYLVDILYLGYTLLNITLYLLKAIAVSGRRSSKFSSVKNAVINQKINELVASYYYDFLQLQNKADLYVAYVLNVEQWIKALLVLAIFFGLLNGCK